MTARQTLKAAADRLLDTEQWLFNAGEAAEPHYVAVYDVRDMLTTLVHRLDKRDSLRRKRKENAA